MILPPHHYQQNNNKLRTDEEINIELSKLDILLMFIRTSKNFLQIQLSTIRYIRWIIIYAMELYPYLAMSYNKYNQI